jgi:hypothetical protein
MPAEDVERTDDAERRKRQWRLLDEWHHATTRTNSMATSKQASDRLAELSQRAFDALAVDASPAAVKALKERLQPLAAELLFEWLTGDQRFESQSQQTEYWLSRFYDEVFADEQPDATHIYTRFGLTLPRAGYVARLLRARGTATWRQAARVELTKRLKEREASARQEQAEGQGQISEYDIGLSPGASDELRVLYDRLVATTNEADQPKPPKAKPSFGGLRWLSVPGDTLLQILKLLEPQGKAK